MEVVGHAQDRVARFIGVTPDDRRALIEAMLGRSTSDVVGYWLQLVLAMGIATLGLAMDSTAVVIGAMLVSPLMAPLIELGAGLATGSLLLSIRAGVRTAASVAVVVVGAAVMTRMLPFHEITGELAARTSPTILDLFVAVFCALAAVYTTVRQNRDMMSAAAGTAIGISLVPPLCTAGYGLGVDRMDILRGGLLLFTANFAAIAAVATVAILLLGFGQVPVGEIEGAVLATPDNHRVSYRAARLTRRIVGRRLGVLRLLIPAVLLGAILVPLSRALEEVSWQVRVRGEVEDLLATIPGPIVRQSLDVRAGVVRVRIFLIGNADDARTLTAELRAKIAAISGHEAVVDVIAVPDAATLDAMATQLQTAAPATPPPTPPATPAPVVEPFVAALRETTATQWPPAAGALVQVRVVPAHTPAAALLLEVTHLGAPLGAAAEQLLARDWSAALRAEVTVRGRAIPDAAITAPASDGARWLPELVRLLELTDGVDDLAVCITAPTAPPAPAHARRAHPAVDPTRALIAALVAPRPRAQLTDGAAFAVQIHHDACPSPTPPP
ncbi:MAG: DUF389 domain-containing protein [Myxococcales bacterium]|nr:DUF389 domain-containing protein [Myxococcales bacterium]